MPQHIEFVPGSSSGCDKKKAAFAGGYLRTIRISN